MSTCIIYHSETGNTRAVAEQIAEATGADLIQITDLAGYTNIGMYTTGIRMARKGALADIEPTEIDITPYDLIVIGTPVWAFRPTPAVNAAVAAMKGCEGKRAVLFATSRGMARDTLTILSKQLIGRGVSVAATAEITEKNIKDVNNPEKIKELIQLVESEHERIRQ